ncbi:unnamed protein product [Pelagomonas calceolata]|uniref:Uncharacterized protein n=1 Tax=Pelagomonas calceolata TaxID=35677 RepID=A0A8J2SEA8_9STRA|nr:unnamed protein product [Pelagomonas calceolata]
MAPRRRRRRFPARSGRGAATPTRRLRVRAAPRPGRRRRRAARAPRPGAASRGAPRQRSPRGPAPLPRSRAAESFRAHPSVCRRRPRSGRRSRRRACQAFPQQRSSPRHPGAGRRPSAPAPRQARVREPVTFDDRIAMHPQARQRRVGVRGVRQHGRGARHERIARVRRDLSRAHAVDDRRDGSRVVVECGCCCCGE